MKVNLRSFKQKLRHRKPGYIKFLTRLEKKTPANLDSLAIEVEKEVWKEVDCLSCANCCKVMTPSYTSKDLKRISAHLSMSVKEFKEKWLYKEEESGDWVNVSSRCQFLNLDTNMCNIYEVRPVDCAGFPHLSKKKMVDYIHIHKQNLDYCPATFKMVEKMIESLKG